MNVTNWMLKQLAPEAEEAGLGYVRVTVRLRSHDHEDLQDIAKRLGVSPTRAATGLLESAINEAISLLRDPQALEELLTEQAVDEAIGRAEMLNDLSYEEAVAFGLAEPGQVPSVPHVSEAAEAAKDL